MERRRAREELLDLRWQAVPHRLAHRRQRGLRVAEMAADVRQTRPEQVVEVQRERRVAQHQAVELAPRQLPHACRRERAHGGGAAGAAQQRDFADHLAGRQGLERRDAVGSLEVGAELPLCDDEERVARLALAHENLVGGERDVFELGDEARDLDARQSLEQRNAAEIDRRRHDPAARAAPSSAATTRS
jgi:hypothetical protein